MIRIAGTPRCPHCFKHLKDSSTLVLYTHLKDCTKTTPQTRLSAKQILEQQKEKREEG